MFPMHAWKGSCRHTVEGHAGLVGTVEESRLRPRLRWIGEQESLLQVLTGRSLSWAGCPGEANALSLGDGSGPGVVQTLDRL